MWTRPSRQVGAGRLELDLVHQAGWTDHLIQVVLENVGADESRCGSWIDEKAVPTSAMHCHSVGLPALTALAVGDVEGQKASNSAWTGL